MDIHLFFSWLILAFIFFFYSIGKSDWRGLLIFISMALFLALGIASWNIESTYVFLQDTGSTITHVHSDYSEATSYLCYGFGVLSLAIGFVYSFNFKDSMEVDDD